MTLVEIILLAVALSIDASVVSFTQGLCFSENKRRNSLLLAFLVGLFQGLMPVIGWFLASSIYKYIEAYDHWVAFGIFAFLGITFIKDALTKDDEEECQRCCISWQCLLLIALATSIDALAAGATLYFVGVDILWPAIIIAVITFINSLIGFWSGYVMKKFPAKYLEVAAGLILIGLGLKVLLEHLAG